MTSEVKMTFSIIIQNISNIRDQNFELQLDIKEHVKYMSTNENKKHFYCTVYLQYICMNVISVSSYHLKVGTKSIL